MSENEAEQGMSIDITSTIDITSETCPMTYVHTRLALDRLRSGDILQVRLRGADPLRQVPASAARQGHRVIASHADEHGVCTLLIRRK
jgi:TusA-related sulfurtransferase